MASVTIFLNRLVWGPGLVALLLGAGLFLSFRTGFAQITLFPAALRRLADSFRDLGSGAFRALCTALAATVGTGNLIGVAGAIALGGPGSIFWMWICGLIGMATKFAEATLAIHFREERNGEYLGGPMYMIRKGLNSRWHPMAGLYAFFGVFAAFGVGNATQINAIVSSLQLESGLLPGLLLAALVGSVILGGAKRIGAAAEFLVPFASIVYLLLGAGVLVLRFEAIPAAFTSILRGVFDPGAVTGGMVGSFFAAMRTGVSRGVFTNEAGMGTASIAHAAARVDHPAEQGLLGSMEVFIDTILICSMTALVILVSGVPIPYGTDAGGNLTAAAFSAVYGNWVQLLLNACICCFAFATVLGWGLYGTRCAQYLLGSRACIIFSWIQIIVVIIGAVLDTGVIWSFAETLNGLMAVPNLIALVLLSPQLAELTKEYKSIMRRQRRRRYL